MEGVYTFRKDTYVTGVQTEQAFLGLITNYGDMDLMIAQVNAERPMWIDPGDDDGLMEFFYILEGSLSIVGEGQSEIQLFEGDSFCVVNLKDSVPIKTSTGVKLLYVTTKPVFNTLYSFAGDMNALLRRCEEKDRYTKNHSSRVMEYSLKICEYLKLSSEIADTISISSIFHDIGKCMIPDEILNKPGKLTREELRYIMKHPIFSRSFLEPKFGQTVGEIVEQHHERLDGSGYPYGLQAPDIRIEARIIAVADSYDAMTTDRSYKKAISPQEAMIELYDGVGTRYEKKIVDALAQFLRDERKL